MHAMTFMLGQNEIQVQVMARHAMPSCRCQNCKPNSDADNILPAYVSA